MLVTLSVLLHTATLGASLTAQKDRRMSADRRAVPRADSRRTADRVIGAREVRAVDARAISEWPSMASTGQPRRDWSR
jgi:hypothetical protein